MSRQPIKRIQNHITDTCVGVNKGEISPEFKKSIDSKFKEKPSELRERRIQKNVRKALDLGTKWNRTEEDGSTREYTVTEHRDVKGADGKVVMHQDDWKPSQTTEASMNKNATIVHEGNQWCVKSHTGKNLGCYDSKSGAEKRLRQVEFFKHQDK